MIPGLSYPDAEAAVEFLERAFGFKKTMDWKGEDGKIMHAELAFGNGKVYVWPGCPDSGDVSKAERAVRGLVPTVLLQM